MTAIYSNGGNCWNILGFNFTKRDALSSVYKISMVKLHFSLIHPNLLFYSDSHFKFCHKLKNGVHSCFHTPE